MRHSISNRASPRASGLTTLVAVVLFSPPGTLAFLALVNADPARWRLLIGTCVTVLLSLVLYGYVGAKAIRHSGAALPAILAIICIWLAELDWLASSSHFALALMLVVAAGAVAARAVLNTGAVALRRARKLVRRLTARTKWPASLMACRTLPEVKTLREALIEEAAPAMPLLSDPRPQVKVAALGALEYRKTWRVGQPDIVLKLAQTAAEPEVRCAALLALGGMQQRLLIESMGESLRDPDPSVRRTAVDALLWDCERRWVWVRASVREALADPQFNLDGPLIIPAPTLSNQAVADLAAWAMESGTLGTRATQSLSLHYSQKLDESHDPRLITHLQDLVAQPRASTVLRVELAQLLHRHGHLSEPLMLKLVEPTNPSPLRLTAVEAMLQQFPNERAVDVLRDVARQPNRELSLAAAIVVQKYLQVDLGLALGEPPPPLHSREAAEVTRRVIEWAKQGVAAPLAVAGQASGW